MHTESDACGLRRARLCAHRHTGGQIKGDKLILCGNTPAEWLKDQMTAVFLCLSCFYAFILQAINGHDFEEENLLRQDQRIHRPCTVFRFISIQLTY